MKQALVENPWGISRAIKKKKRGDLNLFNNEKKSALPKNFREVCEGFVLLKKLCKMLIFLKRKGSNSHLENIVRVIELME